jgi:YD repeat-containing protein
VKATVRVTRPTRKNCDDEACAIHTGNRKNGRHGAGEVIIPEPGDLQAQVTYRWDDHGNREASFDLWDRATKTWTLGLPLPARPRRAHAAAVQRARRWRRTGVLS